jgi:hypothetical protein
MTKGVEPQLLVPFVTLLEFRPLEHSVELLVGRSVLPVRRENSGRGIHFAFLSQPSTQHFFDLAA